ncbi:MAG: cytochrome c biogenesis protein DipZ [Patescibacteria group bacterium]
MLLLLLFAFIGGVVTILSPCIMPILPIILSGSVGGGKKKPLGIVFGFILSFTFFTLFLTSIVNILGISADFLRNLSMIVILGFGISLLVPKFQVVLEKLFSKLANKTPKQGESTGFGGGIVIGLSLGLIWTPCVGPILASVISLAITGSVTGSAFFITIAYSLGTAIPMLIIMYGGRQLLQKVPGLLKNTGKIQKAFGVLMIITAIGIFFNADRSFQSYILKVFPNYGTGLTSLEDNDAIKDELEKLQDEPLDEDNMGKTTDQIMNLAPELIPGGEWINSAPLTLKELRGKVVLLDVWTYSCINCIRTLPYIQAWHEKYEDDGLVVIGIHTPEFEFEKNAANVQKAAEDFGLTYPIMQDNNYATWKVYGNRYWPRKYLIDHTGKIIYDHIGEGDYVQTEREIINALEEKMKADGNSTEIQEELEGTGIIDSDSIKPRSPEIYFGAARNSYLGNGDSLSSGKQEFTEPDSPKTSILYFDGEWDLTSEYAKNLNQGDKVIFRYQGKAVYLVASASEEVELTILKDGEKLEQDAGSDLSADSTVKIKEDRLYRLIESEEYGTHTLEIIINQPGLQAFAFTFG